MAGQRAFCCGFDFCSPQIDARMWSKAAVLVNQVPEAPPARRVSGERLVVERGPALFQAAASEFFLQSVTALSTNARFTVALSGGSTPRGLFQLLATDPTWRGLVPWDRTHFFWGDERHVPPDHADSNFRMADEAMLSVAPIVFK